MDILIGTISYLFKYPVLVCLMDILIGTISLFCKYPEFKFDPRSGSILKSTNMPSEKGECERLKYFLLFHYYYGVYIIVVCLFERLI